MSILFWSDTNSIVVTVSELGNMILSNTQAKVTKRLLKCKYISDFSVLLLSLSDILPLTVSLSLLCSVDETGGLFSRSFISKLYTSYDFPSAPCKTNCNMSDQRAIQPFFPFSPTYTFYIILVLVSLQWGSVGRFHHRFSSLFYFLPLNYGEKTLQDSLKTCSAD